MYTVLILHEMCYFCVWEFYMVHNDKIAIENSPWNFLGFSALPWGDNTHEYPIGAP